MGWRSRSHFFPFLGAAQFKIFELSEQLSARGVSVFFFLVLSNIVGFQLSAVRVCWQHKWPLAGCRLLFPFPCPYGTGCLGPGMLMAMLVWRSQGASLAGSLPCQGSTSKIYPTFELAVDGAAEALRWDRGKGWISGGLRAHAKGPEEHRGDPMGLGT